MNYRLATAIRGPDHEEHGAIHWKSFVTAPLRWMAAIEMDRVPCMWALGVIRAPEEVLAELDKKYPLEEAQMFTKSDASHHVKSHAAEAFEYLIRSPQGAIAQRLKDALVDKGLL